jgi:hypothetical protein
VLEGARVAGSANTNRQPGGRIAACLEHCGLHLACRYAQPTTVNCKGAPVAQLAAKGAALATLERMAMVLAGSAVAKRIIQFNTLYYLALAIPYLHHC